MEPGKIAIELHPRDNWQSFDLGTKLAIHWWKPLYGFWFISAFPVLLLAMLLSPEWGIILLWWFKPLFEMGLLHIISRNIFQQSTSIKSTLQAMPGLLKSQLLPALLWRRLSPNRGFNLAVSQLEGLTGDRRSQRLKVLHRKSSGVYWWLIICVHLETFIMVACLSLIMMLTPEGNSFSIFDFFIEETDSSFLLNNLLVFIAMWMMAPIYQAGSFMAYLNRRIILEGWDIELQFKGIQSSLKKTIKTAAATILICFSVGAMDSSINLALAQSEYDSETSEQSEDTSELTPEQLAQRQETEQWALSEKEKIEQILAAEPFSEQVEQYDWQWNGWQWQSKPDKQDKGEGLDLLKYVAIIAEFGELIFWLVFGGVLLLILWLTRHQIRQLFSAKATTTETPKQAVIPDFVSSGSTLTSGKTTDYPQAIANALDAQNWRLFLSLLLINSLQQLQNKYPLQLHKSDTEQECLNKISQASNESEQHYFQLLFAQWIRIAWSHNPANPETLRQLHSLWSELFAQQGKAE